MWRGYVVGADLLELEEPAERPQEKPMSVELGEEHGLLLSDQGRVYSWGDNRYGQLGRNCVKKDENGRAFVVSDGGLGGKEAIQIAAGKHFSLVLCAMGELYAWGRNKSGQLGLGHLRDVTRPRLVTVLQRERVIRIGCGRDSAVAVTSDGSVWQWGSALSKFETPQPIHTPYMVMSSRESLLGNSSLSRGQGEKKYSNHEVDARVPETVTNPGLFKEQLEFTRQCQGTLGHLKNVLAELESRGREQDGSSAAPDKKKAQKAGISELTTLSLSLDQEISQAVTTIATRKQDLEETTEVLQYLREQLHKLDAQTVTLGDQLDKLQVASLQTTGIEQRKLQEQMDRVREFQDSNSNSKLAMLDQRAEVERKRQNAQVNLEAARKRKEQLDLRVKVVHDFGRELVEGQGQAPIFSHMTNQLVKIRDALDERTELYGEAAPSSYEEFVEQREKIEGLEQIEEKAREGIHLLEAANETEELAKLMFLSLLTSLNEFLSLFKHKWTAQDVDMGMFFD